MQALGSWQRLLPVLMLLAATSFFLSVRGRKEVIPLHQSLSGFPIEIDNWHGRDLPLSPGELEVLGPGEFLLRDYFSSSGEPPLNLYLAYFPSQRSADTIHSPKNCLPGSGWTPLQSGLLTVQRNDGSTIKVNRYLVSKGNDRDLVLYWYQAHGRFVASEYQAKFFLIADAFQFNRTDGALVRIVTPIISLDGETTAQARALRFVRRILPMLDLHIPR